MGDGPPSDIVDVPAVSDGTPAKVTEADRDDDDIDLTWTKPSGTVTGYKIEVKIDDAAWTIRAASHTSTTYTHTGVDDEKRYRYRVSAINDEGTGDPIGYCGCTRCR